MNTNEYLDLIKQRHNLPSDYALAKLLGTSTPALCYIRQGRSLNPELQLKVAELLDIDPQQLAVLRALERAKSPEAKEKWKKVLQRITATAALLLLSPTEDTLRDALRAQNNSGQFNSLYIMRT